MSASREGMVRMGSPWFFRPSCDNAGLVVRLQPDAEGAASPVRLSCTPCSRRRPQTDSFQIRDGLPEVEPARRLPCDAEKREVGAKAADFG